MQIPAVLMIGSGEYTTGYVHGRATQSDKSAGVVALTLFDLQRRGKVRQLAMAGTNGTKFPGIRRHLRQQIASRYAQLDVSLETYPADDVPDDPSAYLKALDGLTTGDLVLVFTPDDTHFAITMAAIQRGCHVLVAKPIVKTVAEHRQLSQAAAEQSVLVAMEVHKRWDPVYEDARDRIRRLGGFSFFQSYMSQPKSQLETFRAWAGRSSDISYYLNAHHIDFLCWALRDLAQPLTVSALAATGVAASLGMDTEDAITVCSQWRNTDGSGQGMAIHTASWIAPHSDVHSQQRFFYMGQGGEVTVDQAHRGYAVATDQHGFTSPNPLFMKYTPDAEGEFAGQLGYGYRSIEAFVDAATAIRAGAASVDDVRRQVATVADTVLITAILQAGRHSLDAGSATMRIDYDTLGNVTGTSPVGQAGTSEGSQRPTGTNPHGGG